MTNPREVLPYGTTEAHSEFGFGLHHVQLAIPPGSEEECQPARKAHPGILVTDLDRLVERLTEGPGSRYSDGRLVMWRQLV